MATFQLHRVSEERVRVEPPASAAASFLVTNTTPTVQTARLSLKFSTDAAPDWITLDSPVRELPASGSESVSIRIGPGPASATELKFWLIAARASAPDDDWAQSPPVTVEVPAVEPKKIPRWVWILLIALGAAALIGTAIALIVILTRKADLLESCSDDDCRSGLQCSARPPGTALLCRVGPGEACESDDGCVGGTRCSGGRCLTENGSSCNADDECVSTFCAGSVCRNAPSAGEPCSVGSRCGRGAACISGICLLPDGVSCTSSSQCQSQRCLLSRCQRLILVDPPIVEIDPDIRVQPPITTNPPLVNPSITTPPRVEPR